jgi:uncharacterized protein YjbJ (UPF0337 family)
VTRDDAKETAMASDELEGKINNGIGRAEAAAGEMLDDAGLKAKGEARQFAGEVEEAVGKAKETVKRTARRAQAAVAEASDQVADTYDELRGKAREVRDTVDPFVREQPYFALALAALGGLILGALMFSGGSKVIYVRTPRS